MIIEVSVDDKTFINVVIVDPRSELQCVDTGDLYSRSIFYASSLMVQHSKSGESYDVLDIMSSNAIGRMPSSEPNVISIWIIRDKIKKGIISNRISPIEEIVHCTLPTRWDEGYEVFNNKSRIIWVQLSKFKNNDKVKEKINKGLKDWIEFFRDPNEIESEDKGMKDAQNLWKKISADDQLKAQQRAQVIL